MAGSAMDYVQYDEAATGALPSYTLWYSVYPLYRSVSSKNNASFSFSRNFRIVLTIVSTRIPLERSKVNVLLVANRER